MGLSDRSIDYPLLTAAMAPALERIRRDRAQAPGSIQPAFDHLLDNLCASALKSKSLLEVSGVVRSRFAERFQQVTGMQPRAYIESLRIEIACRLLQHPRIPILTIGMCLGGPWRELHRSLPACDGDDTHRLSSLPRRIC
jgi:AraC-like DNA-binding protein